MALPAFEHEYLALLDAKIGEAIERLITCIPAEETERLRASIAAWRELKTTWHQTIENLNAKQKE